jgi:hypothetical protein
METNLFSGTYEYMGFAIYNGGSAHIWDIEPIGLSPQEIDIFKASSPSFKTIAAAKKWIRESASDGRE